MTLADFTDPRLLVPRLLSERQNGAITELSKRLESAGTIADAPAFAAAVMSHEGIAPAVFDDIAYPLARGRGVKRLSFACGLAPSPIKWGLSRHPCVTTVFLFAVPLAEASTYLSLVLTLSEFARDESSMAALRRCAQPRDMLALFAEAPLLRAGHRSHEDEERTAAQ